MEASGGGGMPPADLPAQPAIHEQRRQAAKAQVEAVLQVGRRLCVHVLAYRNTDAMVTLGY